MCRLHMHGGIGSPFNTKTWYKRTTVCATSKDTNACRKLLCVQTQCSSEEAFRFFRRNLWILRRNLPISICGAAMPQKHFGKHSEPFLLCVLYICGQNIDNQIQRKYLVSSCGNRTPGSRFYSDLLDTSVCIHQLVLKCRSKALGCSCSCRRLAYGSFHLPRMSWWPRCWIDQAMVAKTKTKHYYSAHNVATSVSFDT